MRVYFLRSRPNQEVLYTMRMKELGVQKYVRSALFMLEISF